MNQSIEAAVGDAANRVTIPGTPVAGGSESRTTAPAVRPGDGVTLSTESRMKQLTGKEVYWQDLVSVLQEVQEKTAAAGGAGTPARREEGILSRQLSAHILENTLTGISMLDLTDEERAILQKGYAGMKEAAARSGAGSIVTGTTTGSAAGVSDRELCEELAKLMNNANDKYLKNYEFAVGQQTEYWKKITQFQKALSDCVTTVKDKVEIDFPRLRKAWDELKFYKSNNFYFKNREILQLYPPEKDVEGKKVLPDDLEGEDGKKEAEKWAADFGPGAEVVEVPHEWGPGGPAYYTYYVSIASSEKEKIEELIFYWRDRPGGTSVQWSTTKYQAWLTSMNSQVENVKTDTQTLTTKYSSANSLYDSLIKLLTATVTTLFDSCKEYLRW